MRLFPTFANARERYEEAFLSPAAQIVKASRWQGVDISNKPEMATRELLNQSLSIPLRGIEGLEYWADDTKCNVDWANKHFAERVGGEPLNPGESWKSWPWGHSADKFRNMAGQFDHTYMERFWPKFAYDEWSVTGKVLAEDHIPRRGIRFQYGDLNDLLQTLQEDPLTRQAYLPVWFPEDGTCKGRRPCTLGYHFINRFDYLHINYYIRSCDFVRHWGDDCYLAIRLLLWVLDRLRERDKRWLGVRPGMFVMHIVSLHLFENDYRKLEREIQAKTPRSSP
jgi:hypothetical protein